MNQLQEARINAVLNTKVRYPEGLMSRREWLELMASKGYEVKLSKTPLVQYSRTKYNRLSGTEQEEYEKKCNIMKDSYEISHSSSSSFYNITKTEYDYFLSIKTSEVCFTCKEPMTIMDHNYGTPELPTCIHCYHEATV